MVISAYLNLLERGQSAAISGNQSMPTSICSRGGSGAGAGGAGAGGSGALASTETVSCSAVSMGAVSGVVSAAIARPSGVSAASPASWGEMGEIMRDVARWEIWGDTGRYREIRGDPHLRLTWIVAAKLLPEAVEAAALKMGKERSDVIDQDATGAEHHGDDADARSDDVRPSDHAAIHRVVALHRPYLM